MITIWAVPAPAPAQQGSGAPAQAVTRGMDDAEASFRFAAEAAAAGDVVGAIAALERVLQTNPDLANIKLELGLLYLRAGNADLARSYIRQAIAAPDAPEAARLRGRLALGSAAGAAGGFSALGSVFANASVQSNPNGSPGSVSVTGPGGVPIIISGDDLSIPRGTDLSASIGGSVQLRYGLDSQRGNDIVLDVAATQTNYADTTELDATYVNARLGPRFFTGPILAPSGYIRPYASATLLSLGRASYFSAWGGGAEFLARLSLQTSMTGQLNYERRDYHNSRRRPTADEQSGDYFSGGVELARQIRPRLRASAGALFEEVDADRSYWSRTTWGGQLGLIYAFAPSGGAHSWIARLAGTYRRSDYSGPDPLVDPIVKRTEDRGDLQASLSIPMVASLSCDLRIGQTWNRSNLPNYDFDNTAGTVGVSYRF